MVNMHKTGLILVIFSLFMMGVNTVVADVPTVTDLAVTVETGGRTLIITVRHSNPSNTHYVSELEVKVGDDSMVVELTPQSASAFAEEVEVAVSGDVQVRAYCNLHGWSKWVSLDGDSDTVDEPGGGIPGFPLLALGLGLVSFLAISIRDR
jgi:desulfoferrodoxin (superoxide reductase-like protein)